MSMELTGRFHAINWQVTGDLKLANS